MNKVNNKKYELKPGTRVTEELLPAIQNLVALGYTETEIGLILGYSGKNKRWLLSNGKRDNPEIKKACEMGLSMAKANVVKSMVRAAIGYKYEEVEEEYKRLPNGQMGTEPVSKKVRKKYSKPDTKALELLAYNLLSDDFKRKIQVENKTVSLSIAGEVEKEDIKKLAGKLMELAEPKDKNLVESKKVESIEIKSNKES